MPLITELAYSVYMYGCGHTEPLLAFLASSAFFAHGVISYQHNSLARDTYPPNLHDEVEGGKV